MYTTFVRYDVGYTTEKINNVGYTMLVILFFNMRFLMRRRHKNVTAPHLLQTMSKRACSLDTFIAALFFIQAFQ